MKGRFEGCIANFYDEQGNPLISTRVYSHDATKNSIEVPKSQILLEAQKCDILIVADPAPYVCSGVVHPHGSSLLVTMYKGSVRENRRTKRYKLNGNAAITALICEGKAYKLHTPIKAEMLNISASGVRIRARYNTMSIKDRFKLDLKIGDSTKSLVAEVMNLRNIERESSEYGCAFKGDPNA